MRSNSVYLLASVYLPVTTNRQKPQHIYKMCAFAYSASPCTNLKESSPSDVTKAEMLENLRHTQFWLRICPLLLQRRYIIGVNTAGFLLLRYESGRQWERLSEIWHSYRSHQLYCQQRSIIMKPKQTSDVVVPIFRLSPDTKKLIGV